MELPELATDAQETVEREARNLIPWLPDPMTCPDCNTLCKATHVYDYRTAAFTGGAQPAWECPECETEYVREEPWHD